MATLSKLKRELNSSKTSLGTKAPEAYLELDDIIFTVYESQSKDDIRVRKVSDLIHGAPIGKPVSNRCHVSMLYVEETDEGEEVTIFTRSVIGSSSEYRIDNKVLHFPS